jgi:hypothetical protein
MFCDSVVLGSKVFHKSKDPTKRALDFTKRN